MSANPLPHYDWQEPARLQELDSDCAVESTEWMLYSWGRTPGDDWLEQSMLAAGVWHPDVGLCDASGAQLAAWLNAEYGGPEYGFHASNNASVSFDDVASEIRMLKHPVAIGGRAWYHWSGCRNYDEATDTLMLANPAPGWQGIQQAMSRADWARLGPWSLVRLQHPAAEEGVVGPPAEEIDYTPWEPVIGSGILELMAQDGATPAGPSTFLPLGQMPALIEEAYATNGTRYAWLLNESRGYRYRPD